QAPGIGKSSRPKPLPQDQKKQGLAASAAPTGFAGAVAVAVAFDLDLRGPSVVAETADQTRRAPHRDVRRFSQGQDAPSKNPAGCADPAQRAGRGGGVCFFAPGFFAQAKKGGSRRHGAKAFAFDSGERAGGSRPALRLRRYPPIP